MIDRYKLRIMRKKSHNCEIKVAIPFFFFILRHKQISITLSEEKIIKKMLFTFAEARIQTTIITLLCCCSVFSANSAVRILSLLQSLCKRKIINYLFLIRSLIYCCANFKWHLSVRLHYSFMSHIRSPAHTHPVAFWTHSAIWKLSFTLQFERAQSQATESLYCEWDICWACWEEKQKSSERC